jgi:hypothetical protein
MPERRRTLKLLAAAGQKGCTGATLLAQGVKIDLLAELVSKGLATAHRRPMKLGQRQIDVARIRITAAGREAIEG